MRGSRNTPKPGHRERRFFRRWFSAFCDGILGSSRRLRVEGGEVQLAESDRGAHHPMAKRKLPRQVDTTKVDSAGASGLGRNVRGGAWPRLSWGRSVL